MIDAGHRIMPTITPEDPAKVEGIIEEHRPVHSAG